MPEVIVHGGAGTWSNYDDDRVLSGIEKALTEGFTTLVRTQSPELAVVRAVSQLEDNPLFNAGTGSCLNLKGEVEMDACIVDGKTGEVGGVTGIQDVKNPIQVAQDVKDKTDHLLLSGRGALDFARVHGHVSHDCATESAQEQYEERMDQLDRESGETARNNAELLDHPDLRGNTVGAVARNSEGELAAATSTGGVLLQLRGRVGDTPVPGAGTYASGTTASSATGPGEYILREMTTRSFDREIKGGSECQHSGEKVIQTISRRYDESTGIIGIDSKGKRAIYHETKRMPYGVKTKEESVLELAMSDGR
ncbi:MAG: isoaspartyl peptidase/L-asparaginase family protein [bacterium]